MSISDRFKNARILSRLIEEKIYEMVYQEMASGDRRDGLWLKAIQKSDGNEEKANSLYIEYRVQSIKDENEILSQIEKVVFGEKFSYKNINTEPNKSQRPIKVKQQKFHDPVNDHDDEGFTPLMRAVDNGDLCKVKELLEQGADPHMTDGVFGTTSSFDLVKRHLESHDGREKEELFNSILVALNNA
jgi:hypothetical protein